MEKQPFRHAWIVIIILGLATVIAAVGIIYGLQQNVDSQHISQSLSPAQAPQQGMSSQVALAQGTAQAIFKQHALAKCEALKISE